MFSSGNQPKDVRADSPTRQKNWTARWFSWRAAKPQGEPPPAMQKQYMWTWSHSLYSASLSMTLLIGFCGFLSLLCKAAHFYTSWENNKKIILVRQKMFQQFNFLLSSSFSQACQTEPGRSQTCHPLILHPRRASARNQPLKRVLLKGIILSYYYYYKVVWQCVDILQKLMEWNVNLKLNISLRLHMKTCL